MCSVPTRNVFRLSPAKITIVYFVFGIAWVASTDWLVVALFDSPETISFLQTIKGWVFVGLSAALLFGLTSFRKRQTDQSRPSATR